MARRSQCSSAGDNPLDPNYLAPHYREEYRLAVDALVEEDLKGYYELLQKADVVDFLSTPEIQYIQSSIQVPGQSDHREHYFLETEGDGSSDTYWPIHSDLEAPGLDLGWPHLHHFNAPTEVTTLINPPEPYMPSIKEQARRLIKNAQQVIAIVMDMFTDVDVFADILNAAMRNVAIYIILDKQNAHHFANMVSNCRVNLQSIQFLRVRTVSGITYHCRSGKSFKGQMMDRFLLTDCRAVLSGNYSFMWSFEKLHRCMAHLFLGQLVSTFDEEFRILFAQSEPLMIENVLAPVEDFNPLHTRQYPRERTSLYRDPRKCRTDDECTDMDWRMMPLAREESLHSLRDMYSRRPSKQSQMDPSFDQGHSWMPAMENPACSGYDKFWNQENPSYAADEHSEPGLPQEMEPPDFDPVLNYLSSTRNVEFDQGSEKLLQDLPLSSSYPRRLSLGQTYACQTSPTPSNDQKQFFQEPNNDHKDPMVKRGLRNLRINSYFSAFDNPGDEGLPLAPPQVPNPLEEPSNPPVQQGAHFSVPKIAHFREFKVPTSRRPSYVKPTDESTAVAAETKTTPTPSESSSITERDKREQAEPKEPKPGVVRREESFRRKYNAAIPRSSRLRSSLIFSSLDTSQDTQTAAGQQDEAGDKDEAEQTKVPFVSQVLGNRRSTAREPFEWSRYIKSATFDAPETPKADDGTSKAEKKDSSSKDENSKNPPENTVVQEAKPSEAELPKTDQLVQPHKSLFTPLYVDMNDPDDRFMFFKELAAKRKAEKAAEADKTAEKAPTDLKVKNEDPVPKETSEQIADTSVKKQTTSSEGLLVKTATAEDTGKTISAASLNVSDKTEKQDSQVSNDPNTSKSCEKEQTKVLTDSETIELKNQSAAFLPVCAETEAPRREPPEDLRLSKPAVKEVSPCQSPTTTNKTPANVPSLVQGTDKSETTSPQTTPSPTASSFVPLSTPAEDVSTAVTTEDLRITPTSKILSPISLKIKAQESVGPSPPESQKDAPGSENSSVAEESEVSSSVVLASPKDVKADRTCHSLSLSSPESYLPSISDLESSHSKPDQKEPITPTPTLADLPPEQSETSALTNPDIPQDAPTQANSPSEYNLTGSDSATPVETHEITCSSPLSDSVGSVMSSEAAKTGTNMPVLHSSSDTISFSSETPADSNKAPTSTESSSSPTEPTSIVTLVTTELDLPSKTPESVTSDNSNMDNQIEISKEPEFPEPFETEATSEVNNSTTKDSNDQARQNNCSEVAEVASDEVVPLSPQSKKPKSTQSRYHSSTAKVLSSSNLRDDTKLLLGQISANSQSRNESTKDSPVTDDEKEDIADKNVQKVKERGIRSLGRVQPKSAEERKELLEKIQSMRKERKVYSRFEMAP